MFAFLLALTLVISGFDINAESVLADEAATLTDVSVTKPEPVPATGGKKAFKLKGSNIKLKDTKAKVTLKGGAEDIADISSTLAPVNPNLDVDKSQSNFNVNLMFPANSVAEDKVYIVSFSVDGGKTFYDKKKDAHESNLSAEPVEITVKGNTDKPNPDVEPEKKPEIDKIDVSLLQGMASLSIKGKNLKQASFKAKVTLADGTKLENFNEHTWKSFLDNSSSTIITLPENNTEKDIAYKIQVSTDGGKTYPANQAVTVTIPKKVVGADTEVIAISEKGNSVGEKKFDWKGGDVNLLVSTKEDTTYDMIKAKITQIVDGAEIAGDVFAQIDVKNTKSKSFKFNAHFPENNGKKAKEYKVVFNAKGSDTEFQPEPVLKVIVGEKDVENTEKKVTIKSIKASVPGLPKTGGISNITIIGANLDLDKLNPSITKTIEGKTQKVELNVEKQGSDKAASFIITFPKAESDKVETYNITLGDKSVTVTVGGRVSGILQEILPSRVYTNKVKTVITVYYDEEIYAVADDYKELKEGITLQANNYGQITESKLTDKDYVTIDANKLVISLATPFKGGN